MRRGTWLVLILLVMSVPQAWATCVQCPNPPCEVQECPPDELATFANMIVAGETVGIGEEVELDDNASIEVDPKPWTVWRRS